MRKGSMRGMGRRRVAMVGAAAAVTLALGAGITSAYAERVILNADGQAVEQDQAGANGQEGIEVVDGTAESGEGKTTELGLAEADESKKDAGDTAAEGDQQVEGEKKADDDAPKGPKVAPQLEVRGPKVSGDPNAKYPSIDAPKVVINDPKRDYIDESGKPATSPVGCKDLSGSKTGWLPLKGGWYCFTKSATLEGRAAIEGDVRIILCDGAKVTWTGGLHMCAGSKLTIYGQKEGTGELVADASSRNDEAGIGGNESESNTDVTICGGHVTAKGGRRGAGIGGGCWNPHLFKSNEPAGNCGKVTIYGGDIEAYGGDSAAGIGSGSGYGTSGGTVTIKGGRVTAKGRAYGAGIGGGYAGKSCDLVLIENASVTAVSEDSGAGIGGGGSAGDKRGSACDGGKVIIRNACVEASSHRGAGIGGGGDKRGARGGDLTIEGASTVRCHSDDGAAIGRGVKGPEDGNGKLSIPDDMRVVTLDADDGVSEEDRDAGKGKPVPAAERAAYCHYRNDVLLEPCKHENCRYERDEQTHTKVCDHCLGLTGEAENHRWDKLGGCLDCHQKRPMPAFTDIQWSMGDKISLTFCVEGPFGEKGRFDDAYMELSIGGPRARTMRIANEDARIDKQGRRCFTFEVSCIEMGEQVSATYHFDDSLYIVSRGSLSVVLSMAADHEGNAEKLACIRSMGNFGHYLQEFLSKGKKWTIGYGQSEYTEEGFFHPDTLDVSGAKTGLEQHAAKLDKGGSDVERVSASVFFGSKVGMSIALKVKPGAKVDAKVVLGDRKATFERISDEEWRATLEGIGLDELADVAKVTGDCSGSFSAELSALSYARAMMNSKKSGDVEREAMAAMYQYHATVASFCKAHDGDDDLLLVSSGKQGEDLVLLESSKQK